MKLTFLGTGAGTPSKERNVSAIALTLLEEENSIWLFDCGEATQHQILHTSIRPGKINRIFITHLHGDHIFGLPGFLSSRSFQGGSTPLSVYGPPGIKKYIETSLSLSCSHLAYDLHIFEIEEGTIIDNDTFQVICKKLEHGVLSFGYRIIEKNKPGSIQVDKLKALGVQPGPLYKQIKENEVTTLPNGKVIHREDVIGPDKVGKQIAILGDTRSTENNVTFIQHVNVLVHEATFSANQAHLANKYFHSTNTEAALLAKEGHVQKLILTHISSRFQHHEIPALLEEARIIFPNTYIAEDFTEFTL